MGWLYGIAASEAVVDCAWGSMVSARGVAPAAEISLVRLADAVASLRLVDVDKLYDTNRYGPKRSLLSNR